MKQIIGRNLKQARELAGISQDQFAEQLGVSRATLSAVENGHVPIDSSKLLSAARILGRPVEDFFNEEQESLALMYRALADAVAPSDLRLQFEHFCKAYRELEEILGVADSLLPPPDYTYNPSVHSKPLQFATQVAYSERDRLALGLLEPIENLFRLFDDRGIKIFRRAIEDYDVYGLSAFSPEYGVCVFVNAANTVERQIFSLAHECGHTLMHRSFYKSAAPAAGLAKDHNLELMANQFAACFLVPELSLREVYLRDVGDKQVGVEDIVHMKRLFRVSAKMMIQRLSDLSLLPKAEGVSLLQEIEKHQDPTKEFVPLSDELIKEWENNSRFLHLLKRGFLGGMISLGKLAELMDVPLLEARKAMQSWRKEMSFAQA
jgi:Zn-dependent peptidase ImmA (M78 family)/DNA-binding XRE family transcriptional regulator